MNRVTKNQLKRAYAFVKENVVVLIVVTAIVLGGISAIAIFNEKDTIEDKGDVVYKEYTSQRIGISNVKTLDPIKSQDRDTYYISKLIFSSLFDYSDNFGLETDLVSSYKTNTSKGKLVITLRDDVYFHKGGKLTADDVVYTYNYILRTGTSSQYYDMANKIYSLYSTGTYKLTIFFKNTNDAALDNLTFPILKDGEGDFGEGYKPNGTGMYKVGKRQKDRYIKLVPNSKYYLDKAKNSIYCQVFPKTTSIENLITTYDVTAEVYKGFDGDSLAADKGLTQKYIPSNNMEYLTFNFNNPILAKKEFRKAVALSLDLANLVKYAYGEAGLVNDCIYFPNYYHTENAGDVYKPSFGSSLELIEKLDFTDVNNDGYLEDENGNAIDLRIVVNDQDASRIMVANTIAEKLDELQIKNHVVKLPWEQYQLALKTKDFDLFIGGYEINRADKLKFLLDERNYIGYYNEEVIKLVSDLYQCKSIDKYKNSYVKLKEILVEELPYYCICYKQYSLLGTPLMEFEQLPTYDDVFRGINTWTYKKKISEE